jgi:hypothetical protein
VLCLELLFKRVQASSARTWLLCGAWALITSMLLTALAVGAVQYCKTKPCRRDLGAVTTAAAADAATVTAAAHATTVAVAATTATDEAATAAAAAGDPAVASAALRVVLAQRIVLRGLWSVTRAAHDAARRTEPIAVSISSGMSVATMQSLLQRTTVRHVIFDAGYEQAPAMTAALAAALRARSAQRTVQYATLTSFTLNNFEKLGTRAVKQLIAALPVHVRSLSLVLHQPSEYDGQEWLTVPSSVHTLAVKHMTQHMEFSEQSHLQELTIEGRACCTWQLPATLRTYTVLHARTAELHALLPAELPHSVQVYDVSQSGIEVYSELVDQLRPLPDSITVLRLPHSLRQLKTDDRLPAHLEVLDTGYCFNSFLGVLPATLRELYIKRRSGSKQWYGHVLGELPDGLEVLHVANMAHSLGVLPDTLKVLRCSNHMHALGVLPSSLTVLKIEGCYFNHSLGLLPDGLVELDLSTAVSFQQPLGVLPQSLKTIKLHSNYRHADVHVLAAAVAASVPVAPLRTVAAAVAAPVIVADAIIDESVHTNTAKCCKLAAAAVTAATVTAAVLYGVQAMVMCYLLQSI